MEIRITGEHVEIRVQTSEYLLANWKNIERMQQKKPVLHLSFQDVRIVLSFFSYLYGCGLSPQVE